MNTFLKVKPVYFVILLAAIMSETAETIRLETWMRDLPPQLKDMPLIYLAIPGSHDSMTFGITRSSGLAPDAEPILKRLYPVFRGTILRWTITQAIDTMQQLLIGIRYFDLRLATRNGTQELFFTHAMYADEISKPLSDVKHFVDTHPGEVVILDCQHFYGFGPNDHVRLIRYLLELFGPRLVQRHLDVPSVTLSSLARLKQSVIIVYRNQAVHTTNELWFSQMIPSPWPQQDSVTGLLTFMRNVHRPPGIGFVHQVVLTPTPGFILFRWTSNLRDKCAKPVVKDVLPVLAQYSPGPLLSRDHRPAPLNVVIADFVDLNDAIFPKTIIGLNKKLIYPHSELDNQNNG